MNLRRDALVAWVIHSQHRWEKHGDSDALALDVQMKLTNQDDWVPFLEDLTGWNAKQVTAFCELAAVVHDGKGFNWKGGFKDHMVKFRVGGTNIVSLWEAKINKVTSSFDDAEMTFRIQATIPDEDVASTIISLERTLVSLEIGPQQGDILDGHDDDDGEDTDIGDGTEADDDDDENAES